MKLLLLIFTLTFFNTIVFSQNDCDIKNEYQKIFKINKVSNSDREYLYETVNVIDSNSCFSDLVNNNKKYIEYLQKHFNNKINYQTLKLIKDTTELQSKFIESLKNDSVFNNTMNILTAKITNKSQFIPDTISMDDLLNVAVKYFYIRKLSAKGYYAGKICTGINGIKETEKERKPQIEAFAFSTIMDNIQGKKYNMYNELLKGIKELYKLNLGINEEEKLLRAQGAMYMFMRHNENLKKLLISEYENKKQYLPFILDIK